MSLNPFDAAVGIAVLVAVITGFSAGLVRSVAAILGYLAAAPVAVAVAPRLASALVARPEAPWAQSGLLLVGVFLVAGVVIGKLLRVVIDECFGPSVGPLDRVAGALLGAARMGLVAVTLVLIFDRMIPPDRQPAFLAGSRLRPILSIAAQTSLKSLPSDVGAYIDGFKGARGI